MDVNLFIWIKMMLTAEMSVIQHLIKVCVRVPLSKIKAFRFFI